MEAKSKKKKKSLKTRYPLLINAISFPSHSLGSCVVWLEANTLAEIEQLAQINVGLGGQLQKCHNGYSDEKLLQELSMLPPSYRKNPRPDLFVKVARAASNCQLSNYDASVIYDRALQRRTSDDEDDSELLWSLLVHVMRKKLALINMACCLNQSTVSSSSTFFLKSGQTTKVLLSSSLKITASERARLQVSTGKNISKNRSSLQDELARSTLRQEQLSKQIVNNLSLISQHVPISGQVHPSAREFARRMGSRKMEGVLFKVGRRTLTEGVSRWKKFVLFLNAEDASVRYLKAVGVVRLLTALVHSQTKRLARAMKNFIYVKNWLKKMEFYAALVEIQRCWRGAVCRLKLLFLKRTEAATTIQRLMRGHLGRLTGKYLRRQLLLKEAVRTVERAWENMRWQRLTKKRKKWQRKVNQCRDIQRVFRGHRVRVQYWALRKKIRRLKAIIKIQSFRRRYIAVLRCEVLRENKRCHEASRNIQRVWRGVLDRRIGNELRRRRDAAVVIQLAWLCCKARHVRRKLIEEEKALEVQRIARGRRGRLLAQARRQYLKEMNEKRNQSIAKLTPFFLGYFARRKYLPLIREHTRRRDLASKTIWRIVVAVKLGQKARARVRAIREHRALAFDERTRRERLEIKKAFSRAKLQRVARGFLGRLLARRRRKEKEQEDRLKNRVPVYFRLRDEYLRNQNMFHRKNALIIQCAVRRHLARNEFNRRWKVRMAHRIAAAWQRHLDVKEAKELLRRKRRELAIRHRVATEIERVVRGFLGRRLARRHLSGKTIEWFFKEVRALGLLSRAVEAYRIRKIEEERRNRSATTIQALVRMFITRRSFLKNYKRLVHEHKERVRQRKTRAAERIQSVLHFVRARALVRRKKLEREEAKKMEEMLSDLENRLEDIHGDYMNDLLATRAQTGVRGMLAKQAMARRAKEAKEEETFRVKLLRDRSATMIQAMIRGVLGRKRFKSMLPALRRARQLRTFCVECEQKVAVRRCRQCRDNYCEICFLRVHKKGTRQKHDWESIAVNQSIVPTSSRELVPLGESGKLQSTKSMKLQSSKSQPPPAPAAPAKPNKADWEQFYDSNAKAKYWFNNKTGEASWLNPFAS